MDNIVSSEIIQNLSKATSVANGTTLITYYVPSQSDMNLVRSHFNHEISSAQNIKDKSVRDGVKMALRSMSQQLKTYRPSHAPANGLILLSGEIMPCI